MKNGDGTEKSLFSNKNALVIGGTGSIGVALCKKLYRAGANLTIHGGHDSKKFDSLISDLSGSQKLVYNFYEDETIDKESTNSAINYNCKRNDPFHKIYNFSLLDAVKNADILCICFGPFLQKPLHLMTSVDWEFVSAFDFFLPGLIVSSVLPHMISQKWGKILLFGGTRTDFINGFKTNAAYGSAKTAISSLVKSIAAEYVSFGIRTNAVLPGFVDTEYLNDEQKEILRLKMPNKTLISPENIADASFFLLSQEFVNGVLLPVDCAWRPDFN